MFASLRANNGNDHPQKQREDDGLETAMRATEDMPMEAAPILMTLEGFDAFLIALSTPAYPVPEMVDVLHRAVGSRRRRSQFGRRIAKSSIKSL